MEYTTELTLDEFIRCLEEIENNSTNEDELFEFYQKEWELRLGDCTVRIPFDAVSFNAIYDALIAIKSEE